MAVKRLAQTLGAFEYFKDVQQQRRDKRRRHMVLRVELPASVVTKMYLLGRRQPRKLMLTLPVISVGVKLILPSLRARLIARNAIRLLVRHSSPLIAVSL